MPTRWGYATRVWELLATFNSANWQSCKANAHAIVDRCAAAMFDGAKLRRKMFLEDVRLEALSRPHYERGLAGDVALAAVFVKISERRASMTGMNAPQSHAVQLIHQAAPAKQLTSTEEISAVLDNLLGITVREWFPIDKANEPGGAGVTEEESAEIDQLRAARGKGPRSEDPSG